VCIVGALVVVSWRAGAEESGSGAAIERLRSTGSPALEVVERGGRVTWAGGLIEPAVGPSPEAKARDFLARNGDLLGIPARLDLAPMSVIEHGGEAFVRLRPTFRGDPILGAQVVVAVRDGAVRHLSSSFVPWRHVRTGRVIRPESAARAVYDRTGLPVRVPSRMGWLPLSGSLVPVWVVEQRELDPPRHWAYVVEATTGTVIWRFDQLQRADGYIYDPNPVVSGGEVTRVTLPGLESDEVLEGRLARAFQCIGPPEGDCTTWDGPCRECGLREHFAVADEEGNFLYLPSEPDLEDSFAEVQGYYHVSMFNQWIEDRFEYAVRCGGRRAVDIHVNYSIPGDPQGSANAFFGDTDGDGCGDLTMGEGMGIDMTYDAEVIYHELTHGLVEAVGGLGCAPFGVCQDEMGLDWTSLGLNEGYADYFSVTYSGDPDLGEHAGTAFGGEGAIRTTANDHICPFDLSGESHFDGMIWAGTGWDIREVLGADAADWLMFHTLVSLANDSSYEEAAAALLESADQAVEQGMITADGRAEVARIAGPEGRRISGCRRVVPLDQVPEGHAEEFLFLFSWGGGGLPAGLQWSLTTPPRPVELRFWVEEGPYPPGPLVAHFRKGQPVGVSMSFDRTTYRLVVEYTEDFAVELEDLEAVLGRDSDPPLEGDTTYYIALEANCDEGCLVLPRGEVSGRPNEPPVADAGADLEVVVGQTVELDAGASHDPQDDPLSFAWSRLGGPDVDLVDEDEQIMTFVPLSAGLYTFGLVVSDGDATDEDLVYVTAVEPVAEAPTYDVTGGGPSCGCRAAPAETGRAIRRIVGF
jgi:hypothetical protein